MGLEKTSLLISLWYILKDSTLVFTDADVNIEWFKSLIDDLNTFYQSWDIIISNWAECETNYVNRW